MGFPSSSMLWHAGEVCEPADDTTFEEVYDSEIIDGATYRRCRVCGARRTVAEDEYGRPESDVSKTGDR